MEKETIWRLQLEDFLVTSLDEERVAIPSEETNEETLEKEVHDILSNFNIDGWAEYVSAFLENLTKEDLAKVQLLAKKKGWD